MLTVGNFLEHYSSSPFGVNGNQVRYVTLIDAVTGEVIFQKMRIEGALAMLDKNLEITEWEVKLGTPHRVKHNGPIKTSIIFNIVVPVMKDVEPYYSEEEWKMIREFRRESRHA